MPSSRPTRSKQRSKELPDNSKSKFTLQSFVRAFPSAPELTYFQPGLLGVKKIFMSNSLSGKRALVTGASKGIGLAIARAFAENGANVVICARQQPPLDKAVDDLRKTAKGKVGGYAADVSKSVNVSRLF